MKSSRFVELSMELSKEGDNFSAAIMCFVGVLHGSKDREALRALAAMARYLSARAQEGPERHDEERAALEELAESL